jgi:hypothetical protein
VKAITLKHPWAFAIAHWGKRIENRTWAWHNMIGQRIAIHGGIGPSKREREEILKVLDRLVSRHGMPKIFAKTCGGCMGVERFILSGIVATAVIDRYVTYGSDDIAEQDPWFIREPGNIGWVLRDVVTLDKPILCRGAQGFWNVPDDVLVIMPNNAR